MSIKTMIENSPALIVLGCLFSGFMSGVGVMEYLDSRDEKLREKLLVEIRAENSSLKTSNENLDATVKELVVKHISQQAIIDGRPMGDQNSEVRKAVKNIDSGEISKIVRDPAKDIRRITKDLERALGF